MPGIEVPPSGGGGGIGGIPTKYLIIGGGAALVAFMYLSSKGKGTGDTPAQDGQATGNSFGVALGPNAALALGDLQTQVLRQSGILQEQSQGYFDEISAHLDGNAASLSENLGSGFESVLGQLSDERTLDAFRTHQTNEMIGSIQASQGISPGTYAGDRWLQDRRDFADFLRDYQKKYPMSGLLPDEYNEPISIDWPNGT